MNVKSRDSLLEWELGGGSTVFLRLQRWATSPSTSTIPRSPLLAWDVHAGNIQAVLRAFLLL